MSGSLNIKDVAKLAGVSVSTVSRVLNGYPDVNVNTKKMVEQVIKDCGYTPNNSARNLKRNHSDAIGVLIKGSATPFFNALFAIMEREIHKRRYTIIPQHVGIRENEVDAAIELALEKRLLGIVFLGGNFTHSQEELSKIPVPAVFCTTAPVGVQPSCFSNVGIDDTSAGYQAVNYLCELGHRKIALITGEGGDESISKLRMDGYCMALKKYGVSIDTSIVKFTDDFSMQSGYDKMEELLNSGKKFTCVFCVADSLAVGASKAILDFGLKIPEDISVMGFDGTDITKFYNPTICTVEQPLEKIGVKTIDVLMDLLEDENAHQHILFEPRIIPGTSCKGIV